MDKCQIAHFNYIGDSILGMYVHFSAGGITSNYKLDGS
jgi:bifunctional N-acetylglucosamine-1-phosphate-uridyltransferase/glucosamine-1-phosphate-acetyltransferase GlmU-like protein